MLRAHARIVKFALQNFFRNFWLSAVTIFILTLSFLTVNFFILANGFTDAVVQRIEDRITIKVYFAPSTQESDVKVFADQIGALSQVELVTYVSKQQALDEFILPLEIADFDADAARAYGKIRADLEKRGTPIGSLDTLIGAHALALGVTLVTNNTREFSRIHGLNVADWIDDG